MLGATKFGKVFLFLFIFHNFAAIFDQMAQFLKYRHNVLERSVLYSVAHVVTHAKMSRRSSQSLPMPLSFSSFSKWAIIWSYVSLSNFARSRDLLMCSGILACIRLSFFCCLLSPIARCAYSLNSTKSMITILCFCRSWVCVVYKLEWFVLLVWICFGEKLEVHLQVVFCLLHFNFQM